MDELLKVAEVAATARVSKTTVREWIATHRLPWVNVGNGRQRPRIRVRRSALERFISERERAAA